MNIRLIKKQAGSQHKFYDFECSQNESLYDAAEQVGIKLPISCKNGVCHICRGELQSGSVLTGGQKSMPQKMAQLKLCYVEHGPNHHVKLK